MCYGIRPALPQLVRTSTDSMCRALALVAENSRLLTRFKCLSFERMHALPWNMLKNKATIVLSQRSGVTRGIVAVQDCRRFLYRRPSCITDTSIDLCRGLLWLYYQHVVTSVSITITPETLMHHLSITSVTPPRSSRNRWREYPSTVIIGENWVSSMVSNHRE